MLTEEKGYVIHSALGSLIFPLALMIILYYKIYRAIQKRLLERSQMPMPMPTVVTEVEVEGPSTTDVESRLDKNEDLTLSIPVASNNGTCPSPSPSTISRTFRTKTVHSTQIQKILEDKLQYSLQKERSAAKTLFIIMLAFTGCWLPFGIMYITVPFLPKEKHPSITVYQIITWLGYFNSALNPIIYTIFSAEFRKGFRRVLCMQFRKSLIKN
jgi:5-hydroxytryptamine receptor 1